MQRETEAVETPANWATSRVETDGVSRLLALRLRGSCGALPVFGIFGLAMVLSYLQRSPRP